MAGALRELGDRPRRVLELRYGLRGGDARSLDAIAGELGVSRQRVRTIEAAALRALSARRDLADARMAA